MISNGFLDGACIKHFYFESVMDSVTLFLATAKPGKMLFVEGPHNVGKKTAVQRALRPFANDLLDLDPDNDQIMPVISFSAPSLSKPDNYMRSLLNSWTEALIPMSANDLLRLALMDREIVDASKEDDRRENRIKSLLHGRETKVVLIHYAERMSDFNRAKSRSNLCIFEKVQSIAEEAGCVVIFTGTFGTFDKDRIKDKVIDASDVEDFPAYNFDLVDDYYDWRDLVDQTLDELPASYRTDVKKKMEGQIIVGSLGCFGRLKDWFQQAEAVKMMPGGSKLSFIDCLQKTAPDLDKLSLLSNALYRAQFTQAADADVDIRKVIGLTKASKPKKSKKRAFKRATKCDPVSHGDKL